MNTTQITQLLDWLKTSDHINKSAQADVYADYRRQPFADLFITKTMFGRILSSQGLRRMSARIGDQHIKVWTPTAVNPKLETIEVPLLKPSFYVCPNCNGAGRISVET